MIQLLWLSKAYDKLIGNNGVIITYLNHELSQAIITYTATKAKQLGQYEDAIMIYQLANYQSQVIDIIIDELSQIIHLNSSNIKNRYFINQIRTILNLFSTPHNRSAGPSITPHQKSSLELLYHISNFFQFYYLKRYDDAEQIIIEKIDIINFNPHDIDSIKVIDNKFLNIDDRIKRIFRYIIQYLIKIYQIKLSMYNNDPMTNYQLKLQVRKRIDALIRFVTKNQTYMANLHHELLKLSAQF